jgi:hypothetical protein
MNDLDDFLTTTLTRQVEAEQAIHNGDPTPRLAMGCQVATTQWRLHR